jgi:hypothetical protein
VVVENEYMIACPFMSLLRLVARGFFTRKNQIITDRTILFPFEPVRSWIGTSQDRSLGSKRLT